MSKDLVFDFDPEKSKKLKEERGVSFEEVIVLLDGHHILDIVEHHNKSKYPHQKIYIVNIEGYAYLVPFVAQGERIFLKTVIPSRKASEQYLESKRRKK